MDQVVRSMLSFGSAVWHALDRAVTLLQALHRQVRLILDALHVPQSLDDGIIALLWVIVLVSVFRVLPVWARFVLVFCTCVMIAKVYGGVPRR